MRLFSVCVAALFCCVGLSAEEETVVDSKTTTYLSGHTGFALLGDGTAWFIDDQCPPFHQGETITVHPMEGGEFAILQGENESIDAFFHEQLTMSEIEVLLAHHIEFEVGFDCGFLDSEQEEVAYEGETGEFCLEEGCLDDSGNSTTFTADLAITTDDRFWIVMYIDGEHEPLVANQCYTCGESIDADLYAIVHEGNPRHGIGLPFGKVEYIGERQVEEVNEKGILFTDGFSIPYQPVDMDTLTCLLCDHNESFALEEISNEMNPCLFQIKLQQENNSLALVVRGDEKLELTMQISMVNEEDGDYENLSIVMTGDQGAADMLGLGKFEEGDRLEVYQLMVDLPDELLEDGYSQEEILEIQKRLKETESYVFKRV